MSCVKIHTYVHSIESIVHYHNIFCVVYSGQHRIFGRSRKQEQQHDDMCAKDPYPLPYPFNKRRVLFHEAKEFNQRGFGAGGLQPLAFSHLKRNWTLVTGKSSPVEDTSMEWELWNGSMEQGQCNTVSCGVLVTSLCHFLVSS